MDLHNPILPGFHPDPSICRRGEDYYIACSSFEWFPAVPIYHSRDMKHWALYSHAITDPAVADLSRLPSAKGIWAPCLTYCQEEGLFYLVYGVMHSMNARYFDIDNFVITAPDPKGPWSEPVYLHSAGFDASMLHDADGRKWVVSLEWETRTGYQKPGGICLVEYDPEKRAIVGYPKRIWMGGTRRGCLEAPHLTRRRDYYYLMCAEGGTGYNHCVTMARSTSVWGPYEGDPENPILTAAPGDLDEREDTDHLKPHHYNTASYLQKCGHGSYVETSLGETYLVHLCARPFLPELRCTLGRETAMQKMVWTEDGWFRLEGGGNLAKEFCPGWLRMRGQESPCSLNRVSLLARKLTSLHATVTTRMEFTPEVYQHSAGLMLYYDNMNFLYLRKYYSQTLGGSALSVVAVENGQKTDCPDSRTPVPEGPVSLRLVIDGRENRFLWSMDGTEYHPIGPAFDTSKLSDEYSQYGEFTGTFVGITAADRLLHRKTADFDFFDYQETES